MSLRNPDWRPAHPAAILCEDVLPPLKFMQVRFAERLGVGWQTFVDLLHGKRALAPEMAVRLATFLGTTPRVVDANAGSGRPAGVAPAPRDVLRNRALSKEQRDAAAV